MTITTTSHTLAVAGGRLHYEVRGDGPLLLIVGAPMGAEPFAALAEAMARDHTVVTHDPRGISGSVLDDPEQDSTPELRADDVAALLDALGAESADVFGSSGGAITGLALVTGHPGRVRTLVAHEPPLLELLADAAERRAEVDDIVETFHRDGQEAAFGKFMASAGFDAEDGDGGHDGPPPGLPGEPSPQMLADGARFLGHELRPHDPLRPRHRRAGGEPDPHRDRHRRRLRWPLDVPHVERAGRAAGPHPGRVPRRPRRLHGAAGAVRRRAASGARRRVIAVR